MRTIECVPRLWACLGLLWAAQTVSATSLPPPAEAFGSLPQMREVVLSPGGTRLAWIQGDGATAQVVLYDIAARKVKRTVSAGKVAKLRNLVWVDDETLLLQASVTVDRPILFETRGRYEFFRYYAVDAGGGDARLLLGNNSSFSYVTGAELLHVRSLKPKTVYLSTWTYAASGNSASGDSRLNDERKNSGWAQTLLEVDTTTGNGKVIERGTPFTSGWVLDRNGKVLARDEWYADRKEYVLQAGNGRGWRDVLKQEGGEQLLLVGPTPDTKAVVAVGKHGGSLSKVWQIPLDGSPPTVLFQDPEHDIESLGYDEVNLTPVVAWVNDSDSTQRWLDKAEQSRYESTARAFRGQVIAGYDESQDHGHALVRVAAPTHPPMTYLIDFATHQASIVSEEYPQLAGVALGEAAWIDYKARDGTSIRAIRTLPPGSSGKNLPLVVLPHGGPQARDEYGFDWLAQFLATRGYAVLQPQFRGSTGFGQAFEEAGHHQWGGLMQDDVTDGVKAMIDEGVADPHRVCIVGASYGGYAALAGAAFTPDLYACAASIGGVSDLPGMLAYEDSQQGEKSDAVAYWKEDIGGAHDAAVVARSPARAAAAVNAPILLIHGVDDSVVPITQSELMNRALTSAGKKSVFVKLPNEDHWLSRAETRVRVLKELETFLAANLQRN